MNKRLSNLISTQIPTNFGIFTLWVWNGKRGQESVALSSINLDPNREILVRIHSECLTGDTFSSLSCDCGKQKDQALKAIFEHGNGIFIYHRQEGRNLGLFKKVEAYKLMLGGLDTYEANLLLSGHPDGRDYSDCLMVLKTLIGERKNLTLLSNNPYKKLFLERHGYRVTIRPLYVEPNFHNQKYFTAKEQKFSHYATAYQPYVGVTLWPQDIEKQGAQIIKLINSLDSESYSRKLFLGLAIFPSQGDLKNSKLTKDINDFAKQIKNPKQVNVVLHLNYDEHRQFHRELKNFLETLNFRCSLQFRLQPKDNLKKIDLEVLDVFKKEHLIFQIKKEQFQLLENSEFVEYFRRTNNYLLLDESFGQGIEESFLTTRKKILTVIGKNLSHIAVAGGYDKDQLNKISALEDYFKIPISVDAESKLRRNEKLDLDKVENYLNYFFTSFLTPSDINSKK